ncbi:MAG TPA: carboxypeptidase regulatory-like domain-containing protein [Burkholderiales bacterium]|nr:carboxypeptidase regulatory-like domain-containing protein [Burkholderiales bacterium]
MTKTASAIFASFLCTGVAHAAMQNSDALPPLQTRGELAWVSGGIGESQAKAFEHASARYPLTLEFIVKPERKGARAEFTAAVPVKVTDQHGKELLSATSQGPFMLLRLPHGRYTVIAERHGRKIERHVVVGQGHHRIVFEWTAA